MEIKLAIISLVLYLIWITGQILSSINHLSSSADNEMGFIHAKKAELLLGLTSTSSPIHSVQSDLTVGISALMHPFVLPMPNYTQIPYHTFCKGIPELF